VVFEHERGSEQLRQIAPLGEEDDAEAQGDDVPALDLPVRLGAELVLGLALLFVGAARALEEQDPADEEHEGREHLDRGARQPGEQPADRHRDRRLHGERRGHPDPDEQRPEPGRHDQGGDERLVG